MKFTTLTTLAALASTGTAKKERTFAVLHFNDFLLQSRLDPIVAPGKTSAHVHNIQGGSNFHKSVTGEELLESKCSTANVVGDNSAYWYPALYFKDPKTGKLEAVDLNYFSAYYFFEPTNETVQAFPVGLQMVSGDAFLREMPEAGTSGNQMRNRGAVSPAGITCPRLDNIYEPPSWPVDSDGTTFGVGDENNKGYGVGFPDYTCTGEHSPMRVDIHFPSCYKKSAGLTNYKNNMAWPKDVGDGKQDCGEGYIHVPHLFFETYWSTQDYAGRWDEGKGEQPFVFSNGDVTGYSAHADFMAAWDTDLLQSIIDNCNTGTSGMGNCDLKYGNTTEPCKIDPPTNEKTTGTLDKLPGDNPFSGFSYGPVKNAPSSSGSDDGAEDEEEEEEVVSAVSSQTKKPASTKKTQEAAAPSTFSAAPEAQSSKPAAPDYEVPAQPSVPVPESDLVTSDQASEPTTVAAENPKPTKATTTCKRRTHTEIVWKTVVVTETKVGVAPRETNAGHLRRHAHGSHIRRGNRF